MKAFVGHSFDDKDKDVINEIIACLSQKIHIIARSGMGPQNKPISSKVKKEIDSSELFIGIFTRDKKIKADEKDGKQLYTTSNWVLQESGYAIGTDTPTILMVEEDIYRFPALQGDQELIYFNRDCLDKALVDLVCVIFTLRVDVDATGGIQTANVKPTEDKEDMVVKPEPQESEPSRELIDAYFKKDLQKIEQIYTEKFKESLKEADVKFWDSLILSWKYQQGDINALRELEKRSKEEANFEILYHLASCYNFTDNEALVPTLSECVKLANNNDQKVQCTIQIADYYAKNKKYDLAIDTLVELTRNASFNDQLEQIFIGLMNIAKKEENDHHYILFAEKVLDINRVNTDVRFHLAFKYSNTNKDDLAIYHYKKLLDVEENEWGLNNIAVCYSSLDMKAKGVSSYEKSIAKKNTLAFANVAYKYLNEGFTDLAEKLLVDADKLSQKGVEVHENIGYAKKKLKDMLKEEEKKEKKILSEAQELRAFNIRYANAYCMKPIADIDNKLSGEWSVQGKWKIQISFNNETNTFEGSCEEKVPDLVAGLLVARTGLSSGKNTTKIRRIEVKGTIKNSSGEFSIKRIEDPNETTGLGLQPEPYSATGIMIINDDLCTIDTLEEDSKNNRMYSQWAKIVA